jgi:folate-dependent tRNA-U54 methylase TrmFO/GidA
MNANFGIIAPLEKKIKGGKKYRNEAYGVRSLDIIRERYGIFANNENTD